MTQENLIQVSLKFEEGDMTIEGLIQIGLVLEEVVNSLEVIHWEACFIYMCNCHPDLHQDLVSAIHHSKEASWKYLETLEKVKSNLEEALEEDKVRVASRFIKYCEKTENLDDLLEDQLPASHS
jgi:hypothetical protein